MTMLQKYSNADVGEISKVFVSRKQRRLIDRVAAIMPRTEFRKMETGEDQEAVYRLRYEAFRREDAISENAAGLWKDAIDEQPNTSTYGVFINGKLCSSIRLSILTTECPVSPSIDIFGDRLRDMIKPGKVFVDPTRFVTDYGAARDYPELPYLTLRVPSMAGLYYDADLVLSSIRSNHVSFYQRVFHAGPIGDAVYYPTLKMDIRLLSFMPREYRKDILTRYPFFNLNYLEGRQLFGPIDDIPGLAALNKMAVWRNRSPKNLEVV